MPTNSDSQLKYILNKPIIILTNFWDANVAVRDGLVVVKDDENIYKINIKLDNLNKPDNFEINSIALQHPDLDSIPNIKECCSFLKTVDIFCPTYDMLMSIKNGGTWEKYYEDFFELMKLRKSEIKNWVSNLENKVYLLCCWENTSGKSKCHRQIIYDIFKKSKFIKDNLLVFYRHGGKKDLIKNIDNTISESEEKNIEHINSKIAKLKSVGLINDNSRVRYQNSIIGSYNQFSSNIYSSTTNYAVSDQISTINTNSVIDELTREE